MLGLGSPLLRRLGTDYCHGRRSLQREDLSVTPARAGRISLSIDFAFISAQCSVLNDVSLHYLALSTIDVPGLDGRHCDLPAFNVNY